jgi:hypothetical protein
VPLDPVTDPFLVQHRLRGKPLLPVVVGLEALTEAAAAASRQQVVGFRDVQMLDGLQFHSEQPLTAQVRAEVVEAGLAICTLTCDFRNRAGGLVQQARPYLQATAILADRPAALSTPMPALPRDWAPFAYPDDAAVYHGPAFRGVTDVALGSQGGWTRIRALPLSELTGRGRREGWTVPSCVLDAALYACGIHLWLHGQGAVSLPQSIGQLQLGRAPRDGETCYVQVVCREIAQQNATYDFTVWAEDGAVLMRAENYGKVILTRGVTA